MMHLTEDQLYHLAELSCDAEELNTEEDQQFEHVKSCRECFNQYCVLATILDATSLNCDLVFDPVQIPESTVAPVRKLLVALRVTCERVYNTISLIGEQIPQNMATFAFERVLATAVRGSSSSKTSILRMEDLDDEDTPKGNIDAKDKTSKTPIAAGIAIIVVAVAALAGLIVFLKKRAK